MLTQRAVKFVRSLTPLVYGLTRKSGLMARTRLAQSLQRAKRITNVAPARRLICFIVCLGLILSSQPTLLMSIGKSAEKGRVRLTQGAPGPNLPNLYEARRMNPGAPKIAPSVSAAPATNVGLSALPSMQEVILPMALLDQRNRVGTGGEDLLSRNYNWGAPIVSLPGRAGLDLNLGLSLNSLIWTKSGTNMHFNPDRGFPSAGFRLGFPEISTAFYNTETQTGSWLVTMPSGQRYEFRENTALGPNVYEEMGGTRMLMVVRPGIFSERDTTWTLLTTDGAAYKFKIPNISSTNPKCIEIKDRNGNYIGVTYTGFEQISAITDTLGRVVNFNYDGSNRLTSITQNWSGATHTYATFTYENLTIQTNFLGLDLVGAANGTTIPVLSRMNLPDGKVYAFEYNTYAQVRTIRCYAPNSAAPSNFPDDYTLLSYISYDLTPNESAGQTDCPRFSSRRDWATGWNAVTETGAISLYDGDGSSWGSVMTPDGTLYKEVFGSSGWQRGLTLQTETWAEGSRKKWTTSTWVNDNPNVSYWLNPRVVETRVGDDHGSQKKTTLAYADYGAVSDIREYDASSTTETLLRHTHFQYLRGTEYTGNLNRRLTQLVTSQEVKDGNGALYSKVSYEYDLGGEYLAHQGPPIKHDTAKFGLSFVQGRGNLNLVRRWDVTDPSDPDKSVASTMGYNTSGSVIFSRDPLGHQERMIYTDSFSDSVDRNTLAYPTEVKDADQKPSAVQYNYDFGAPTRTQDPKGAAVVTRYDPIGRVERVTNQVNQAYTRYVYATDHLSVNSFVTVNDLSSEFHQSTVFDGHGRTRVMASEHPGSDGGYKAQSYEYDIMGRMARQTNPTEVNGDWEPAGDDAAGWAWSSQAYDWQGRPTVSTNQDMTTSTISYEGCGCAGGQKVALVDEVGRRREQNFDILGRMWRERTYNWGGSNESGVYTTTINTYNIRDQITNISVTDNATGAAQNTVMSYDGHGRLKEKWLPIFQGNPQSETPYISYEYYEDDLLKKVTDPRGASSTQVYNNRHLVTGVTYGAPAGVAATPNVTFAYDEAGNRTVMDDGPGMVTYTYDTMSRLTNETRVFDGISRYHYQGSGQPYQNTFSIGYQYNLAGGLKQIQTPTGDNIDYTLDKAGRTTRVYGTPRDGVTDYITDIRYRAWGAAKRVSFGYANYSIDAQFNGRMLISSIDDQSQFGVTYNYNAGGQVSASQGIHTRTLDRSFSYDHLGRVTQTRSGSAVGLGSSEPEQLKQDYIHDAFGHMTSRSGRYWYTSDPEHPEHPNFETAFTATYVNDRATNATDFNTAQNWQYDAAGNIKSFFNNKISLAESNDIDAASRTTRKSYVNQSNGELRGIEGDYEYDGDGNLTSKTSTWNGSKADYYVRSTVLSKTLLSISIAWFRNGDQYFIQRDQLLNGQFRDRTGRNLSIYAGGEEIATRNYDTISLQDSNKVTWQHRDPHASIAKIDNAMYSVDPLGVLVKTATQSEVDAHWAPPPSGGDPSPPQGFYSSQSGQYSSYGYSSPFPGNWGLNCYVDGIQMPCERAFRFIANGSGRVDQVNTPTGSVQVPGLSIQEKFKSHSTDRPDGWVDGKYVGGGDIVGSTEYEVELLSVFNVPDLQTKQPKLERIQPKKGDRLPDLDAYLGYLNAANILSNNKKCREAVGSRNHPDPLGLLNTLKGKLNINYYPNEMFRGPQGLNPRAAASTKGIGPDAKIRLWSRYFSMGGATAVGINVDGKTVALNRIQFQTLTFLHELSHATGKYNDDPPDDGRYEIFTTGSKVNEAIYKNCIKGAKLQTTTNIYGPYWVNGQWK